MVDATAGGTINVEAGTDVNTVTADAGVDVNVDAESGTVDMVDATAAGTINVEAGTDVNTVTADAGVNVNVDAESGTVDMVDATAGGTVNVEAGADINDVLATAGGDVIVNAQGGSVGDVAAMAGGSVDIDAMDDVEDVDADAAVNVNINAGNDIGGVNVAAGEDVAIIATENIDEVEGSAGDFFYVFAGGSIEDVEASGGAGGGGTVRVVSDEGDIGSVVADANYVSVDSNQGNIGSVNADAVGIAAVNAFDGAIGSVEATGDAVYVYAHDDIDSAQIVADRFIEVISTDGDIATVNADAGLMVFVGAYDGAVQSVTTSSGVDVTVYASDDIGSVTANAGEDVYVTSRYGNIVSVSADASDNVDVRAYNGDIGTVEANAGWDVLVYATDGSIDEVIGTAQDDDVRVVASDDIGSVTAVADDDIEVRSFYGDIGSVFADADDDVEITARRGDIGSVDATADDYVGVYANNGTVSAVQGSAGSDYSVYGSDGVGMVDVSAGGDVYVWSSNGDIGSVTADASDSVYVSASNGGITSVSATSGYDTIVFASDDIGSVDATAGYYASVTSSDGSIGDVDLTVMGGDEWWEGGDAYVFAGGDITSATLDVSDSATVTALGSITGVSAIAGNDLTVQASDDIGTVTATVGDDLYVTSFGGGDVGIVNATVSDDMYVTSLAGSIDTVTGSAQLLQVDASDNIGTVDVTLNSGEDELLNGAQYLDAFVNANNSIGSVTINAASDESLELVVASVAGSVGDVTANLGQASSATIDVHAQSDDAVTIALTGNVDNDSSVALFVGSAMSDPGSTGPVTLNLSSNGVTSDGDGMGIDLTLTDNLDTGEDEVSLLETINFAGDSNVSVYALPLDETLTTWDGSTATGDQSLVFGINDVNDQVVSVSTGSGDDDVNLVYQSSDDHGDVSVNLGAGNDSVNNDWFIGGFAGGSLTIDAGSGSDDVYVRAGSGADINVTAGDDDDVVTIESDVVSAPERIAEGSDLSALEVPGGYVDVSIDVDAGTGDDIVTINANRESIEAGTFAMGSGTNELYFNYHPSSTPLWSDSDIARFTAEMGDNVTGGVHTLGLNVDLDISDDVTLALPGEGGVSILEIGEIELVTDDAAHGSTLTIEGAAEDLTISMAYSSGDDLGDGTDSDEWMDDNVLRLALDGVTDLTIDADDIGVLLEASQNSALESVTITSGNDDLDLGLVGFEGGLDVSVQSGTNGSSGDDAQVFAFGGEYGEISVVSSDDEAILTIEAADEAAGVDVGDYTFSADSVTLSAMTAGDADGYANQEAELEIDGYTVDYDSSDEERRGVATVTIDAVTMTGDHDSDIDVYDLSDGSTVSLGEAGGIDINILASDDSYDSGGIDVDGFQGSTVTLGAVDVDIEVGGEDYGNRFELTVEDGTDSAVSVGNITVDRILSSDADTDSYGNSVDVTVANVDRSEIEFQDITANLAGAGFSLDLDSNDNSTVDVGVVNTSGSSGSVRITNTIATSDGTDVFVDIDEITMHDDTNDFGLVGEDSGLSVIISDNTDDFTAGMVEISTGNITLSGSDSATVQVTGNRGEYELFDTPLVPLVGVQIDIGDIDIDLNSGSDPFICDDVMVTALTASNNVSTNIGVGQVSVDMGSDSGYVGYFVDQVDGNDETVYTRMDTTVAIGSSDAGGYGYGITSISGNTDSDINLGSYTVTVGMSDAGVGYGYVGMGINGNELSTVDVGDITLVVDGNSDAGFGYLSVAGNDDTDITLGAVTVDGASDSTLYVGFNTDSSIEMGTVDLGGDGLVEIASNLRSTIEMGDVTVTGEGSDAGDLGSLGTGGPIPFLGDGVFAPGLIVTDNESSTVTVGDFTSTDTYTDADVMIHDNVRSSVDVEDISLENVTSVDVDIHGNTDATVTVGAVMVSDATGNFTLNVEETFGTDASVTVGNVDITGVAAVDVEVDYNHHGTVTIGNINVSDATGGFELSVGYQTDAEITIGTVVSTSGINGEIDIDVTDNQASTITIGDMTFSDATGTFYLDVEDNTDSEVSLGHITYSSCDDDDVYIDIIDNKAWGTDASVTVGNLSFTAIDDFDLEIDYNDNAVVTVGNILVSDATADFTFEIDQNDGEDTSVTVGTVTYIGDGGDDIDFRIEDNDDASITVGNLFFSDTDDVDIEVSTNTGFGSSDGADITVGSVTVIGLDTLDVKITDHTYATVTVGDMLFSDATGSVDFHFTDNNYSTVSVGDFTFNGTSGDFDMSVTDSDYSTITLGSISSTQTSGTGADLYIEDNRFSTIGSDSSSITLSTNSGSIDLEIDENDNTTVMFSDVTLTNTTGSVSVDIMDNEIGSNDNNSVSIGDLTVSAGTNVDIDIDGDSGVNANSAAVGDIDVTVTGTGTTNDVDIELNSVEGAESITVSGNVATLEIRLGDQTNTVTATTEIDMGGMTNENADIFIDFVDESGLDWFDDRLGIGDTPLNPAGTGDANFSDDVVITFGEFASAYVESYINDNYDTNNLQDFDGVRQTYVFEGSDIGDITIEGFVAGFGAYRDVDVNTTRDGFNSSFPNATGGRDERGDSGGEGGRDFFVYNTANPDDLVQLRTDRLDFSQFEGVDSLEDLSFEYDDDLDAVIITAGDVDDPQFTGRIIVTGTGVDSDNGDSIESIIDRVADSIIFG
jgi:hypothetical protein